MFRDFLLAVESVRSSVLGVVVVVVKNRDHMVRARRWPWARGKAFAEDGDREQGCAEAASLFQKGRHQKQCSE